MLAYFRPLVAQEPCLQAHKQDCSGTKVDFSPSDTRERFANQKGKHCLNVIVKDPAQGTTAVLGMLHWEVAAICNKRGRKTTLIFTIIHRPVFLLFHITQTWKQKLWVYLRSDRNPTTVI